MILEILLKTIEDVIGSLVHLFKIAFVIIVFVKNAVLYKLSTNSDEFL